MEIKDHVIFVLEVKNMIILYGLFQLVQKQKNIKKFIIKNKVPIRLSNKLQTEIIYKANKVLNLYNHGMKNIVFPNIDKILERLIKMERN